MIVLGENSYMEKHEEATGRAPCSHPYPVSSAPPSLLVSLLSASETKIRRSGHTWVWDAHVNQLLLCFVLGRSFWVGFKDRMMWSWTVIMAGSWRASFKRRWITHLRMREKGHECLSTTSDLPKRRGSEEEENAPIRRRININAVKTAGMYLGTSTPLPYSSSSSSCVELIAIAPIVLLLI
ncbi:hypothetical protein BHE74_00055042 [Ensete ventricosum]|nr:hypothetical protein BHE74_00055042 [Ensete ventricosum]